MPDAKKVAEVGPANEGSPQQRRGFDWERLGKAAVVAAAFAYALGLVTTNAYLLRFAASDFDLLRPRFVLLGSLLIGVVMTIPVSLLLVLYPIFASPRPPRLGLLRTLMLTATGIAFAYAVLILLLGLDLSTIAVLFLCVVGASPLVASMYLQWLGFPVRLKFLPGLQGSSGRTLLLIFGSAGAVLMMTVLVPLLAQGVLPRIPVQLGGVKPYQVSVIFKPDTAQALSNLGIAAAATRSPVDVRLLYEGQSFLLISPLGSAGTYRVSTEEVLVVERTGGAGI